MRRQPRRKEGCSEISMRIFHQRLFAAKVLISDKEADEIVFRAVSRGGFNARNSLGRSRRIEGPSTELQTIFCRWTR